MRQELSVRRPRALMLALAATLAVTAGCSRLAPEGRERYQGRAEVRRDAFGVPHVKGETVAAAVYGFAYAQAEDQIGNIMKRMLNARGELAKHFGPSMVERDVFAKRYHVHDGGEGLRHMTAEVRELYEAYAAGVNAYIEDHRDELPEWVQPITPGDVLGASRAALMGFVFNRDNIIGKIQAAHGATAEPSGGAAAAGSGSADGAIGSNMFALAPERTTTGRAMLMGNPHLSWELTWYEGHLTVPGEYNIYGAAFVGGPVPTIAFNETLGWSHTVNYPDTEDVYVFREDPSKPDHILYDGVSHALTPVEFAVEVKTESGIETQDYLFWETEFGPVVHRHEGRAWVLKSSVMGENGYVEQWYRMGRARNLDEFLDALDMNSIPMFNVIYADRDGHILYRWMARLPKRPEGQDGTGEVEVDDSAQVWSEIHAAEDLPQLINPAGGTVHNANDAPWYTTLDEIIPASNYPPYTEAPRLRLRSQHGLHLLASADVFSLEDVITMKHSLKVLAADRLRDELVAAARTASESLSDLERRAVLVGAAEALAGWDGRTERDSRGGTLFHMWWMRYAKDNEAIWAAPWDAADPMGTPRGLGDKARAVAELEAAAVECHERFGALDVAWGDAHRLRRGPVDVPMNGGPGDIGSYRVIDYKKAEDGREVAYGGDGWVFAVEFADVPVAKSILVTGQSEKDDAAHATDQVERFIEGNLKDVLFTEEAVEAGTVRRYRP